MLKTFKKGGTHPEEYKLSAQSPVKALPVTAKVIVPVSQSLGAAAKIVVEKGAVVKTGQLIAKGEAFISANVHSPVSGKVVKIEESPDQSGYRRLAIHIDTEGDVWEETIDLTPDLKKECNLAPQEIVKKINEMGIVGMGGATFPTHVKLSVPEGKKVEALIINGVECEPFLTSDHRLMLEKGEEVMVGIRILMKALNVSKAYIGIENNKPDAIAHMQKLCKNYEGIEVVPLKVKYPQGAEKQLIKAITGREVPSLKLPLEVGCVVNNVGTAFAVYEAVQKNKPLIERIVTVTGTSVKYPSNFLARIGTPVSQLIQEAGGLPEDTAKIISGGPMMGKALASADVPVTKGTSGILLIPEKEVKRVPVRNCIRCARCVSVCPMGLQPFLLEKIVINGNFEMAEAEHILDCMECGSCHYTCPSGRPLLDFLRVGKSKVSYMIRTRAKN